MIDYTKEDDQIVRGWGAYFLLPWVGGWIAYVALAQVVPKGIAISVGAATAVAIFALVFRQSRPRVRTVNVLDAKRAEMLALDYLHRESNKRFVLAKIEELLWGWRVETVPSDYAISRDERYLIPGHGPLAVLRSGTIKPFPSLPDLRVRFERELEGGQRDRED